MRKVILDANFLLLPFQFKIDIFGEIEALIGRFEPVVLSTTLEELKKLSTKKSSKISKLALSALEVAGKCRLIEARANPGENYDDVLLRVAREDNCLVATNDRKLREKLRENGVPTIFLRQRSYLQVEGYI
jgi:rRNA-processing protein FCF1